MSRKKLVTFVTPQANFDLTTRASLAVRARVSLLMMLVAHDCLFDWLLFSRQISLRSRRPGRLLQVTPPTTLQLFFANFFFFFFFFLLTRILTGPPTNGTIVSFILVTDA
jgi:hypothetical protein